METEEELVRWDMTVKEMIEELKTYNQDAKVEIIVDGMTLGFKFAFGNDYGNDEEATPETCDVVSLFPAYEWEKAEWETDRDFE